MNRVMAKKKMVENTISIILEENDLGVYRHTTVSKRNGK
jgi:hypothetical protein